MYTAEELRKNLEEMEINPCGTLMVHSSMKSIGAVEGGADTVLDVLCDYMKDGLLLLPTHTWASVNKNHTVFDVRTEPSCVGVLTNLFRVREGVVRSLHPTHSIGAFGREAEEYIQGEEKTDTPCPRNGCWGRLYDRKAQILFLGCPLKRNTFIHSVEEWADVPNRQASWPEYLTVIGPDGQRYEVTQYRHYTEPPVTEVSQRFDKLEPAFVAGNAIRYGRFGDAKCILGDAVKMADITLGLLAKDLQLFDDDRPLPV